MGQVLTLVGLQTLYLLSRKLQPNLATSNLTTSNLTTSNLATSNLTSTTYLHRQIPRLQQIRTIAFKQLAVLVSSHHLPSPSPYHSPSAHPISTGAAPLSLRLFKLSSNTNSRSKNPRIQKWTSSRGTRSPR